MKFTIDFGVGRWVVYYDDGTEARKRVFKRRKAMMDFCDELTALGYQEG